MVEIPVRHKEKKGAVPLWLLIVGLLTLVTGGLFLSRSSSPAAPASPADSTLPAAQGTNGQTR